jgi:hypothetical protein
LLSIAFHLPAFELVAPNATSPFMLRQMIALSGRENWQLLCNFFCLINCLSGAFHSDKLSDDHRTNNQAAFAGMNLDKFYHAAMANVKTSF